MIRLFLSQTTPPWSPDLEFTLDPDQGRYLTSVMRRVVGDVIAVFNGRDGEWSAQLVEVGKKAVRVALREQTRPQTTTSGPVLAISVVKRAALEYIVEKATELGVQRIQPVITHRSSNVSINVERLVSIAKESSEQTERLDVPDVMTPVTLDKLYSSLDVDAVIFADEDSAHEPGGIGVIRATKAMLEVLAMIPPGMRTCILIGPEGGFDEAERAMLRSRPDCYPVNMGPRILRADTAAISALTLYQAVVGDWR